MLTGVLFLISQGNLSFNRLYFLKENTVRKDHCSLTDSLHIIWKVMSRLPVRVHYNASNALHPCSYTFFSTKEKASAFYANAVLFIICFQLRLLLLTF